MLILPWENFFHCNGNTYGTWLRGDPRGWRSHHHREHVEGDYKNLPPAGKYAAVYQRSKELMKWSPVILTPAQRRVACRAIAEALQFHKVEIIDLSVGAKHWHLLARFWPLDGYPTAARHPRRLIGLAKTWANKKLKEAGVGVENSAWGEKCKCKPIADAGHFANVTKYIPLHVRQGQVVWSLIQGDAGPGRGSPGL